MGLATARVGLTEGDLAITVCVCTGGLADGGLEEGVGDASGRVRVSGLIGGELIATLDGGLLPTNRTVGLGDLALGLRSPEGDFAL